MAGSWRSRGGGTSAGSLPAMPRLRQRAARLALVTRPQRPRPAAGQRNPTRRRLSRWRARMSQRSGPRGPTRTLGASIAQRAPTALLGG
eukprot:12044485-Alexandrium_andersonii.AAC.1